MPKKTLLDIDYKVVLPTDQLYIVRSDGVSGEHSDARTTIQDVVDLTRSYPITVDKLPDDLQGLIGLPGVTGFVKKLGPGDYTIDSTPYVTTTMLDDVMTIVEGEIQTAQTTLTSQVETLQLEIDAQLVGIQTTASTETANLRSLLDNVPYDIATMVVGRPAANAVVLNFQVVSPFITKADVEFGVVAVERPATGDVYWNIMQNGTPIGTVHFAPSSTTGVISIGDVLWEPGHVMVIQNGASQDNTLSTAYITIKGLTKWLSG